jgi:hypothetical protein
MGMIAKRKPGTVWVPPPKPFKPLGYLAQEAEAFTREREARLKAAAIARAETEVPNRICYADTAFKDWKPGDKIPTCHRCDAILHPNENHKCPGFQPKYVQRTPERKERWEAQREAIHESRAGMCGVFCSECGEHLEDFEDGQWHWEDHQGKPERHHYAIDGEPDGDLEGYEDEPEEDYCEDDDGYDCD